MCLDVWSRSFAAKYKTSYSTQLWVGNAVLFRVHSHRVWIKKSLFLFVSGGKVTKKSAIIRRLHMFKWNDMAVLGYVCRGDGHNSWTSFMTWLTCMTYQNGLKRQLINSTKSQNLIFYTTVCRGVMKKNACVCKGKIVWDEIQRVLMIMDKGQAAGSMGVISEMTMADKNLWALWLTAL